MKFIRLEGTEERMNTSWLEETEERMKISRLSGTA